MNSERGCRVVSFLTSRVNEVLDCTLVGGDTRCMRLTVVSCSDPMLLTLFDEEGVARERVRTDRR